jgi:hypothetical protein
MRPFCICRLRRCRRCSGILCLGVPGTGLEVAPAADEQRRHALHVCVPLRRSPSVLRPGVRWAKPGLAWGFGSPGHVGAVLRAQPAVLHSWLRRSGVVLDLWAHVAFAGFEPTAMRSKALKRIHWPRALCCCVRRYSVCIKCAVVTTPGGAGRVKTLTVPGTTKHTGCSRTHTHEHQGQWPRRKAMGGQPGTALGANGGAAQRWRRRCSSKGVRGWF